VPYLLHLLVNHTHRPTITQQSHLTAVATPHTTDHIWRCPAEHLPNALVAHAGCFKYVNTIGIIDPVTMVKFTMTALIQTL